MSPTADRCGAGYPAPDLDLLLAPHATGYAGADAALSIRLDDRRVLWVFGDTLVGECSPSKRSWTAMPKNTVAIQHRPFHPAFPDKIDWVFADAGGTPTTFFRLPESATGEWFWPGTGIVLSGKLFLFGYGVVSEKNDCDALAFRVVRQWLIRVEDIAGPPGGWTYAAEPVDWRRSGCLFGSACIAAGEWLYVVGYQVSDPVEQIPRSTVIARVAVNDILRNGAQCVPEFLANSDGVAQWTRSTDHALALIFEPGVTENSVYFDAPRNRYLATTYTVRHPEFLVTTAPALEGPWNEPTAIYSCPEGTPPEQHLFYTFRMHPHLAAHADEMVFTYVVNAREPDDLTFNTSIYYPRFLRVDLREI